jgi:NAD-dependent SIR2 family protein deacetylase
MPDLPGLPGGVEGRRRRAGPVGIIGQHRAVTLVDDAPGGDRGARAEWAGAGTPGGNHDSFGMLAEIFRGGGAVVLSGAGLSTESGIPDYRGPTGLARRAEPMTYQTFTGSAAARQRYWARSHLGWRFIGDAVPNAGHHAVADLERLGLLNGIITQNVDGLHQAAGARGVTELHGSLHRIACLSCGQRTPRLDLDRRLRAANLSWTADVAAINPDGDAVLADSAVAGFRVVDCAACGGILKPDVVFFGENVPKPRVEACYELVSGARALVVLGSSLTVMSGYRYVRHAAQLDIPVLIVNQGETRGDRHALRTLNAPLGQTLRAIAGQVTGRDLIGRCPPVHRDRRRGGAAAGPG